MNRNELDAKYALKCSIIAMERLEEVARMLEGAFDVLSAGDADCSKHAREYIREGLDNWPIAMEAIISIRRHASKVHYSRFKEAE